NHLGVEVVLDVPRQRAAEDDVTRDPREIPKLVGEHLELLRPHGRTPLVHLREGAGGRVDDRDRRARLVGDADEVVEDPLEREVFDDAVAGPSAGEAGRDDRRLEALERARDVDPFAPGTGEARTRAM